MRPLRALATLVLASSLFGGCTKLTSILLVIDGDLRPGVDVDTLVVRISARGERVSTTTYELTSNSRLPESLELVPGSRVNEEIVVQVVAVLGGEDVVSATRRASFRDGEKVEERVCLWRACQASGDSACTDGTCQEPSAGSDGDADGDTDGDAGDGGAADAEGDADTEAGPRPPGSRCVCDVDCIPVDDHQGVCMLGICMTLADGNCSENGASAECGPGSRCWGVAGFEHLPHVCWPDCVFYECEGSCDADGSCTPTRLTNCDPTCGDYCGVR